MAAPVCIFTRLAPRHSGRALVASMPSQLSILCFAAAGVVTVICAAHPRREEIRRALLKATASLLLRLMTSLEQLFRLARAREKTAFFVGSAIGFAVTTLCILILSRRVPGDFEVLGFPFVFRTAGGYIYLVYWDWLALFGDLLFAAALAVVAGFVGVALRKKGPGRQWGL